MRSPTSQPENASPTKARLRELRRDRPGRNGDRRVPLRSGRERSRRPATIAHVSGLDRRERRHAAPLDRDCAPERRRVAAPAAGRHSSAHRRHLRTARFASGEEGAPLIEAIRRATLLPASVLEAAVPAMRRKGRVQAGVDADLVVFDPERITDQATYTSSTRPSSGITHVLVDGVFVVRDGELVQDALPGRPIRAEPR